MPPNTVSVARPGEFGNPWPVETGTVILQSGETVRIGEIVTAAGAVDRFRRWMRGEFGHQVGPKFGHPIYGLAMCPGEPPAVTALAGKNLACWCPLDQPCHADVLLEFANA